MTNVEETNETRQFQERWPWLLALASLLPAMVLGALARGPNTFALDYRISDRLVRWQGQLPDALQRLGDLLGSTGFTLVVIILLVLGALLSSDRWHLAFFVCLGVLRWIASLTLKPLFHSNRPGDHQIRPLASFDGWGYPSGHTLSITVIAVAFVLMAWATFPERSTRSLSATAAGLVILLVGWSRIWAGAHWFTDVVGSVLIGTGLVGIAWGLANLWTARASQRRRS